MFETNADVAALFIGFGNLADISSLRQSKRLENHATMVMHVLDEAISSMDDTEYVIEMLQGIGKSHRKIAGFDPNFFLKIEEPFLLAVQETLQDRYSANISHVYKITIRFILMELTDGYRNGPDDDRYSENG
ncbi:hypothetical protein FSP39_024360 [Pinctada imbricata]|uniref:Globin domain-containing protein n=1 Tax=Pinctada imbricata TaxID=66713 RepID=A0AA89BTP0_PINIB|nr:hypothetical protein FSP39_024360 [Pinctada imbricata]